jgi:hypothetical protein
MKALVEQCQRLAFCPFIRFLRTNEYFNLLGQQSANGRTVFGG